MSNYRKIYEQHYGPIPKDNDGRTYEVHHIDGNHKNDSPENLIAVSIQEHYNIHYKQGDWAACHRIAVKMKLSHQEISELATKNNLKRVADGTHPFSLNEIWRLGIAASKTKAAIQKRKQTYKQIGHQQGEKNSQAGTMWITNGKENKKIKKNTFIPCGWNKGRIQVTPF